MNFQKNFKLTSQLLLTFSLLISIFTSGIAKAENAPQQISTWTQLNNIRVTDNQNPGYIGGLNGDYILINDLDDSLSDYDTYASPMANDGAGWLPIPNFSGHLNGNGHLIKGLNIDQPNTSDAGLFSHINNGATISNLGLEGSNTIGDYNVGALAAYNLGVISKCFSTGAVRGENYNIGGLVGKNEGLINNSYSTTAVSGDRAVGGLVGYLDAGGQIINSYASGNEEAIHGSVGGLVGVIYSSSSVISNSYATGMVSSETGEVGGFAGLGFVNNFATNGYLEAEGVSAFGNKLQATLAYAETEAASFYNNNLGLYKTWDFNKNWQMPASDYPTLSWTSLKNISDITKPLTPKPTLPIYNKTPIITPITVATATPTAKSISPRFIFKKDLKLGMTNNDVKELQKYLNLNGYLISKPNKETSYFGPATKNALIKFQKAKKINPASGLFGQITRKAVNAK